jgi:UDP-N-acetylmuramoyl-L-alanyl-D-glutamate--2,6-diaminopimelate ligase
MKLAELIPGLPLAEGLANLEISGLTEDSRQVQPGMLFAAFKGTRTDGMRFAAQAAANGAAVVLTGEDTDAADIGAPVLKVPQPRGVFARAAARFYGCQPETIIGVTGTNGKTSVASFTRQLWAAGGHDAGSLGTVGVVTSRGEQPLKHTTPDAITLHQILAGLGRGGVTHLALEASSHGLEQARLDGVRFAATAFTNITRDHLDYHMTFEAYFAAKLRLFRELAQPGTPAVIDADSPGADVVAREAALRGLEVMTVGREGEAIRLQGVERTGFRQRLSLSVAGRMAEAELPLAGDFQVSNALVAAGLALATGDEVSTVLAALGNLRGAKGRLEFAGETRNGAQIFIDYAHTPDALAKALLALRPYTTNRLHVVFGCGGDRDPGKRPQMGMAAAANADVVIVTDDNPRSEDPAAIRQAVLAGAPRAAEIGDRAQAIAEAIAGLRAGDVLLVAGKGHEAGQMIGAAVVPFSDHEEVAKALNRTPRATHTAMAHHG